jgi:hypothetical protein
MNSYDPNADHPPWIKRSQMYGTWVGVKSHCFHHVQAIMLTIDQHAESALGNRHPEQAAQYRREERQDSQSATLTGEGLRQKTRSAPVQLHREGCVGNRFAVIRNEVTRLKEAVSNILTPQLR